MHPSSYLHIFHISKYGDPRDLPSFPTRRSSDLIFTAGNLVCALAPSYEWLMAARVVTSLAHGTFFGVGSVVATDRKSTRLNSSHVEISYAVFCLKKKKKKKIQGGEAHQDFGRGI